MVKQKVQEVQEVQEAQEVQEVQELQEVQEIQQPPQRRDRSAFLGTQFRAEKPSIALPVAMLLNKESSPGLYISASSLSAIGWKGDPPTYQQTFNSGEKEVGILLTNPHMLVFGKSHRLIESKIPGTHPVTRQPFKPGDLIGDYETTQGQQFYQQLKEWEKTQPGQQAATLRTFYVIMLVDPVNRCFLHDIPICLSVKGTAATFFGQALQSFQLGLSMAFSENCGDPSFDGSLRNERFNAFGIFSPTFTSSLEGAKVKNWVCAIKEFNPPSPENFDQVFMDDSDVLVRKIHSLFGLAGSYLLKFLSSFSAETGIHALVGVSPEEISGVPDTGEDYLLVEGELS